MVKELDEFHLWAGGDGGTVVNDDDYEDFESLLFRENNKLLAENDDERNMLAFEVNQRIIETPRMSYEQDEMAKKLLRLNPLGLQLNLASNWTNSITNPKYTRTVEAGATYESCEQSRSSIDFGQQPMSEKLKASNFAATFIRIGSWERKSKNEGDLVAKCYFAKKKLVWELLKGGLKSKIEIQWNDIIGISAVIKENEPGTLQVELNLAPTFHEETDPQPRKHTIWKPTSDFTGGQASICRRHFLTFPAGYLDKHYEKLLNSEPRLFELSKQSFPTLKNPYFRSKSYGFQGFSFNYNRRGQNINPGMQFHLQNFPPHLGQAQHIQRYGHIGLSSFKEISSPSSVMDFSPSDSHNVLENRRMAYWGQGMSNYTDAFAMNQGLVPGVPSTQVHPAVPFHNYNLTNLGQEAETNNQLLGNMQVVSYDEKYHMARVDSLNQLVSFNEEVNPERNNASQEIFYGQDSSAGENANVIGEQFYQQQPVNSMPQIHPANPLMPQQWNILPYDPVNNPNPTVDEFGNVVNFNNNWS